MDSLQSELTTAGSAPNVRGYSMTDDPEAMFFVDDEEGIKAGDWFIDTLVERLTKGKTYDETKKRDHFGGEEFTKVGLEVRSFMALPAMKEFERHIENGETWCSDSGGDEAQPTFRDLDGEEVLFNGELSGYIDGLPVIVSSFNYGPNDHRFNFYYRKKDKAAIEPTRQKIWKRIEGFEWFRGKVLHFTGDLTVLNNNADYSFDDVVLDEDVKTAIRDNTVRYLEEAEELEAAGLEVRRGLLFSGAPGNGKSLTAKIISANAPDGTTTIWVTGSSIQNINGIRDLFKLARSLKPSLLIIEDLDTLGGNRDNEQSTPPVLGELLTQMDGVGGSDGVITVATTNYAHKVDDALKDRPRRFDRHFVLPPLNEEARYKLLCKHVEGVDDGDLWRVASRLDGRSGAVVEEVVHTAKVRALREDVSLTKEHLFGAIDELTQNDPSRLSSPEII